MDSYIINLVLQYNFILIYVYFVLIIFSRLKKTLKTQILAGMMLSFLYMLIIMSHNLFNIFDFPDSRYVIISIGSFFFGPISAIFIVVLVAIKTLISYPSELIKVLFILFVFVGLFSYFGSLAANKNYKIKWYNIFLAASTIPVISLIYAILFFNNSIEVSSATAYATSNAPTIFVLTISLTFVIFYANNREKERSENMKRIIENEQELLAQNMEIRALYEEMAASEETLRENYDELERYKDKIEYTAYHNQKTGILNRDALMKDMGRLTQFDQTAILYLRTKDLEYYINTLGQTLIEILHCYLGETLKSEIVQLDNATLYDISEGRFCILLTKVDENELQNFIKTLNLYLSQASLIENVQINLTVEIGGVRITSAEIESSLWLEYSEIAMLEGSREKNKNGVTWFNADMYTQKYYKARLELDLHKAVSNGELYLMYQPQYDQYSRIIGAEALLRWSHKEYGIISPTIFIPLAETMGLIDGIGQFVLESVVSYILKMRKLGKEVLPIAINVSFLELINPDFFNRLDDLLVTNSISANEICIEITETSMSNQLDNVFKNITNITNRNIELHLDDFGTGYSSISHLSNFPISVIKIDKSFIDSMLTNHKIEKIILTIIELAHRIDMRVIAEGVETQEQFLKLSQLGCDYFQGYYFSKPLLEETFDLMSTWGENH